MQNASLAMEGWTPLNMVEVVKLVLKPQSFEN